MNTMALLSLCNKSEEYVICYAEAEKGLRTGVCTVKYDCYLSLALNESHAAGTNSFRQTLGLVSPGLSRLPRLISHISLYRLYIHRAESLI